jgi:hypothetical protein
MKTSELTGTALDWAVAKCEGLDYTEGRRGLARCRYARTGTTHRQLNGRKAVQSLSVKAYLFYVSSRALKVGDCGPQLQAQVKQLG